MLYAYHVRKACLTILVLPIILFLFKGTRGSLATPSMAGGDQRRGTLALRL